MATIMHADIAGYSRLMGENEEDTIRRFRGHREIFESVVKMHRGRIFNTAGDALLAEFPSSVEAVRCATEIQAALHTRNEQLPPKERLQFRIGINLGDVIVQGGDLLGDGVNIAARVQTAADPGGISISGSVYDQIQNKLSLHFQPLGEKSFKNIAQPIRTFAIQLGNAAPSATRPKWGVLAGGVAGVVVLASAGFWGYQEYSAQRAQREAEAARQAADAAKREAEIRAQRQAVEDAMRKVEEARKEAELRAQTQAADEAARKSAE
ncbi:MAG TPA: adenylate/guanylate cyclase domain-containing protein, partial [Burkholderiales bacterium]|nr:adenylate/guanylate cyclase domain-containing protein [Burkholderiales bacterium]